MARRSLAGGVILGTLAAFGMQGHAHAAASKSAFALLGESTRVKVDEPLREAVVRSRQVSIDRKHLAGLAVGQSFALNLFDDAAFEATIETAWSDGPARRHWKGRLEGIPNSTVIMVLNDGALAAIVRAPGFGIYRIRSSAKGGQIVEDLDTSTFPPCGNGPEQRIDATNVPVPPAPEGGIAGPTGCSTFIDVMIVYTPEARDLEGGQAAIEAIAALAIDECNLCYANSAINPRAHLVYTGLVDYAESGTFGTDLDRLTDVNDGFMDEVHTLRDQYGADLVDLLISNTQGGTICGLAWIMVPPSAGFQQHGFSVCNSGCTNGGLTLPHELGHNMGCAHDRENSGGPGAYPFSFGWRFTASDGQLYRTVMSYAPGNRIQYFSNPAINYLDTPTGVPAGQPDEADNAQSINLTASIVAGFRSGGLSSPIVWGQPLLEETQTALAGDRAGDAVAVDHSLAIVGAYTDDAVALDAGAAYIYRLDNATGLWQQEAKITAPDGQSGDRFGISVDIVDDADSGTELAIVGAYLDDDGGRDSGSAYVFRHTGDSWSFEHKLVALDPAGGDSFGYGVSLARAGGSDVAIIGAYLDDDNGTSSGSAYIFRNGQGGWAQEAKIKPTELQQLGDQFGVSVAIAAEPAGGDQYVLIGAWKDDAGPVDAGSAYVFKKVGATWTQTAKLVANDAASIDQAGFAVALSMESGRVAVVGAWKADGAEANSGAAYVFRDTGSGWTQEAKLTATDPNLDDSFGDSVAVSGDAIIVGAYLDDLAPDNLNTGAAYIYRFNGSSWINEAKLVAPDALAGDQLGFSVGISGTRAVLGAWSKDNPDVDSGAFYTAAGVSFVDCNNNGSPDECDIAGGISLDENGDGTPDECEAPPDPCPSDITNDGHTDVDDLFAVINSWGACAACPSDIVPAGGDGVVDIDDLFGVINGWGACSP